MNVFLSFLIVLCCFLQGCEEKDNLSDLKKFIETTKNGHINKNTVLPTVSLEKRERYAAADLRNPFARSEKKVTTVSKKRDPLQSYPIDSLQLVGVLAKGRNYWAAIMLPTGHIMEVGVGAHLGLHDAMVESITQHHLKLKEQIITASGEKQTREILMEVTKGS